MGKIIETLKKIILKGAIEPDGDTKKPKVSKVTNKVLLQELVTHFEQSMEELSVGRRLLYPMSFNILMHPDDYDETKESFPFVLPEVISQFYASIKKEKNKYLNGVNYAPPATYWFFQFSACRFGEKDGHEGFLERGKIITTGSLTTFDIQKAQSGGVRSEANIHLSVKCQNSNTNDNNINMDALLGMDILSEGTYKFNFDKNMNEDTNVINAASTTQEKGWATLRWSEGTNNMTYTMLDTYIDVSGSTETRKARNVCKIMSDSVAVSHVQIRYDQTTQTFQLAAFAKTRLNSREVPLSTGGAPDWVSLPKFNSKLFLNDAVSIVFNANDEML